MCFLPIPHICMSFIIVMVSIRRTVINSHSESTKKKRLITSIKVSGPSYNFNRWIGICTLLVPYLRRLWLYTPDSQNHECGSQQASLWIWLHSDIVACWKFEVQSDRWVLLPNCISRRRVNRWYLVSNVSKVILTLNMNKSQVKQVFP